MIKETQCGCLGRISWLRKVNSGGLLRQWYRRFVIRKKRKFPEQMSGSQHMK